MEFWWYKELLIFKVVWLGINLYSGIGFSVEAQADKNIEIVSAMGAGNRCDIPAFEVADVYKTYNDGLAKLIRKRLRSVGVEKHNVVFTKSVSQPKSHIVGSISYYPSMCGCTLSAFVINELLKGIVDNDWRY